MFKIIPLNEQILIDVDDNKFTIDNIKTSKYIHDENFNRTLACGKEGRRLDLSVRSSWTNKYKYLIETPIEAKEFFTQNNILQGEENDLYDLLKYEEGDFFENHIDTQVTPNHRYTCIIYCPYSNEHFEGGELILQEPNNLYEIKFNPANYKGYVMVIFSIDMYHKVLPIIKGTRWIYKKRLCINI